MQRRKPARDLLLIVTALYRFNPLSHETSQRFDTQWRHYTIFIVVIQATSGIRAHWIGAIERQLHQERTAHWAVSAELR